MSADTAVADVADVAEPTPDELHAKLVELDANVTALNAKRETLVKRAAECTREAADIRQELARAQLGDNPDEKAMKNRRGVLLDREADAQVSSEAATAIARTLQELARERAALECDLLVAGFHVAEKAVGNADRALSEALLEIPALLGERFKRLCDELDACQVACNEAHLALKARGEERRIWHPEYSEPYRKDQTAWIHAARILDVVTHFKATRPRGSAVGGQTPAQS